MRKTLVVMGVIGITLAIGFGVSGQQPEETLDSKVEKLVEQRMAQRMLEETSTLDQQILDPKNWHTAIFNGVNYTIYTGPGDIAGARWANQSPPTPPKQPTPEKEK